jgi:glycosyltransferase involved in cell wall biosynthesis
MRIIHLINHCRFGHGNVHAAVDLACAQSARGDEVWVASGDGELVPLLAKCGVRHILIDQEKRNIFSVFHMIRKLMRLTRDLKPQIFHAHMMTGAIIGYVASRFTRVKLVTTVHNAFDKHSIIMALGDRVIAVSTAVSAILQSRGVPLSKIRIVLNGTVGAPRRDFFSAQPMRLEHPAITTLCGLHDRKGVRDLISAFTILCEKNTTANLYIAGDGPSRKDYELIAADSGQGAHIHFLGEVRDTKSLLKQSDIFVLASHAEPFGLVITEAREAGCAIVASDVDGIPEALDGGRAGILVAPQNPAKLAEALLCLLSDDDKLDNYKLAAKSCIDRWSIDRVAADLNNVYKNLLTKSD